MGRPAKHSSGRATVVALRLSPHHRAVLYSLARRYDCSISDLVSGWVDRYAALQAALPEHPPVSAQG